MNLRQWALQYFFVEEQLLERVEALKPEIYLLLGWEEENCNTTFFFAGAGAGPHYFAGQHMLSEELKVCLVAKQNIFPLQDLLAVLSLSCFLVAQYRVSGAHEEALHLVLRMCRHYVLSFAGTAQGAFTNLSWVRK